MKKRLEPSVFDLARHELRRGYRSDVYFWREKIILENDNHHPNVLMQIFQKKEAVLCGTDEALAILKIASGYYKDKSKVFELFDRLMRLKLEFRSEYLKGNHKKYLDLTQISLDIENQLDELWVSAFDNLVINSLFDGDSIHPHETVMTIEGDASHFAHLETVYLGVLARRTRIATNVHNVTEAAKGKPIMFFPARFDHWAVQGGDGYAAHIGGTAAVSTDAQAEWWGAKASGTIPHALIACYKGDTALAAEKFAESYPDHEVIALVDFQNDCVETSLDVAKRLGSRLWGVRLDTSESLVDKSLISELGQFHPTGVCAELVQKVREALDKSGHDHVKIIVSGGFDVDKISNFEEAQVPVDAYGVGSSLMRGTFDFTGDIVMVDGKPCSKVGRLHKPNEKLSSVH